MDVPTSSGALCPVNSAAGGDVHWRFEGVNGALTTARRIADNPLNPLNPLTQGASYDDEFYNLALGNSLNATPFLQVGDTFVELKTINPSNDDNVFGLFFSSTFQIGDVITSPVPEPETYAMMLVGLGLVGFSARRRKPSLSLI